MTTKIVLVVMVICCVIFTLISLLASPVHDEYGMENPPVNENGLLVIRLLSILVLINAGVAALLPGKKITVLRLMIYALGLVALGRLILI